MVIRVAPAFWLGIVVKFTSLMRAMFVSPVDLFGSDCLDQLCLKMSARGVILDDSVLAS